MKPNPTPKLRATILAVAGLSLILNPLWSATNTWNGAGVTAGSPTTGTVWTDSANYTGTTFTNLAADDMDFSTITSPGSSLTLSAAAGTYNVRNLNFGTAGSTLATAEFLNFNGNGTPGGTTLNLAGTIALPKFTGSVVVLGSDLTLNLNNASHAVSATGTGVLIVNALVTGGGAAASFTNASTAAPMILTNNNNSFINGGLSGSRYNGYVGFTSVGNVGSGPSSLGNATTSANGVLWMSNSSTLDYIGVGNQSTDRAVRLDGTVNFLNSSAGTTITYNGAFTPNGVSGAEVRVAAVNGSTIVIDSVISGNLGIRRQSGTTYSPTTGASSSNDGLGTLVLGGANTHSGSNLLNIGTTKITNASALGYGGLQTTSAANTQIATGAVLDLNGQSNVNEPIVLAGGSLLNNSTTAASIGSGIAASTVAAATGSGSGYSSAPTVAISGTGTGAAATASLGVTAASFSVNFGDKFYTVAPTVTITGGTGGNGSGPAATATAILSGGSTGTLIGITITNAGTGFTTAPTITFGAGTSSSGTINASGTGNASNFTISGLSMTSAGSDYTGTPTFAFTGGGGSGSTATAALSSVTLTANSNNIGGSGDLIVKAVISETGSARSITKIGTGTVTLAGANTYTGATAVSAGILNFANTSAKAAGTVTAAAGGTIGLGVGGSGYYSSANVDSLFANTLTGFVMNAASGVALDTTAGNFTYASDITGTRVLTKLGVNTLTLSGTNNYTGGTRVDDGTMAFANSFTLSGANQVRIAALGTAGVNYATVSSTVGTLTFGGTLGINIITSLSGGEIFNLFTANGGALAGNYSTVSLTGSYIASLTDNGSGIWTASANGLDFTFATSGLNTGILSVAVSSVPEPSTYAGLLGTLVLGVAVMQRRRSRKSL